MVYLVPVVLEEPDVPLPVAPEELSVEPDEPDEPDAPDDPLEPDAPDAPVEPVAPLEPDDVPAAGGQSALAVEPGPAEALAPAGPQSALLEPVVPVVPLAPLEPDAPLAPLAPDELSMLPELGLGELPMDESDEPVVPDAPLEPEDVLGELGSVAEEPLAPDVPEVPLELLSIEEPDVLGEAPVDGVVEDDEEELGVAPVLPDMSPLEVDELCAKAIPAALNSAINSADDFFIMFLQWLIKRSSTFASTMPIA